jgi:GT2 family glycosyltransferase
VSRLTVSIVNYRTPDLVIECIDSLRAHAPTGIELEIVVVENASGDGSAERIATARPDVRVIRSECNLGFAGGNNLALRACDSEYVLLLNSDAKVEAGTLDGLIAALDARPRAAAVGARIVNATDGADQDYPCRFPTLPEMVRRALGGPQFPGRGRSEPVELERLHGACMLIRGAALRDVGLLDDGFFMYDEDVDWCVRARARGWSLWLVPALRVLHHGGSSSQRAPSGQRTRDARGDTALRMRIELRRSRYRLYRKHRGLVELLFLKALTDLVMLLACVRTLARWLALPSERDGATAMLRNHLRVLGLNPFAGGRDALEP